MKRKPGRPRLVRYDAVERADAKHEFTPHPGHVHRGGPFTLVSDKRSLDGLEYVVRDVNRAEFRLLKKVWELRPVEN